MNPGDVVVQAVFEDIVIKDIRFNVPRGVGTVIPGNLACDSRDLGRLMSEKRIIPFGSNPRLDNKLATQPRAVQQEPLRTLESIDAPEVIELRDQLQRVGVENQRLSAALEESRAECGRLLADCSKLRSEISKLQEDDSKFSTILGRLDSMPDRVVVKTVVSKDNTDKTTTDESDVPYFVPTFPEPVIRNMGKAKTNVVENTGETPGEALKRIRKVKSS
jgi:hypothetical protein